MEALVDAPSNGVLEIARPEFFGTDDFIRRGLTALRDAREVIDAVMKRRSLVPAGEAAPGTTRLDDWFVQNNSRA